MAMTMAKAMATAARVKNARGAVRSARAALAVLAVAAFWIGDAAANSYAGRSTSIGRPRYTGITAFIDQDSDPTVPADGQSSNFWIGLNQAFARGAATTNWVQIGWSRERLSAADPTLVKRRYVEWSDMSLGPANRHHLVFYAISARSAATYTVQLNGLVWEWLASDRDGDVVLDNTKADGDWAKNFCTAQAQAEMIRNANNVNCVGKRNLRCCMFSIQTRRNAGAYANDDLGGTNTISGNTAADDINMISVQGAPNAFCVWDKRN